MFHGNVRIPKHKLYAQPIRLRNKKSEMAYAQISKESLHHWRINNHKY